MKTGIIVSVTLLVIALAFFRYEYRELRETFAPNGAYEPVIVRIDRLGLTATCAMVMPKQDWIKEKYKAC